MPNDIQTLLSLGDISIEEFLSEYWQKKPLLVRSAIPPEQLTITGEELAGFALEDWVESRIISELNRNWRLENGPFTESRFLSLPKSHWTLLVQAVDQFHPQVNQLLDYFRFIPNWRLDDIMISYATDQGSVGPHFDQYDVFLLQGQGRRRWQIGQFCDNTTGLIEGTPLSLVKDFAIENEWVLEPGDMLYLPPKLAHWGVSLGECITYSVGFRAPNINECLSSFADFIQDNPQFDARYTDLAPTKQTQPGLITKDSFDQFKHWFLQGLADEASFQEWFGREMTRSKYDDTPDNYSIDSESGLKKDSFSLEVPDSGIGCFSKSIASRWAYIERLQNQAWLFVDGCRWQVSLPLAKILCEQRLISTQTLVELAQSFDDQRAVVQLIHNGLLCDVEDD